MPTSKSLILVLFLSLAVYYLFLNHLTTYLTTLPLQERGSQYLAIPLKVQKPIQLGPLLPEEGGRIVSPTGGGRGDSRRGRQNESKSGLGSQGRGLPGPGGKEDVERRPGAGTHHLTADSGSHFVLAC